MTVTQDADLVAWARRVLARHPVVAVGTVAAGVVRQALVGAPPDANFEIGSVSKGLTGLLHVQALERGEITGSSTLGDHLPLTGSRVADLALTDVATHRSGLPRLAPSPDRWRRTVDLWRRGANPYGETLDELLVQARSVTPRRAGPSAYSNLGYELLGHALAAAAGTTYAHLLRTRLADPLGLDVLHAPSTPADLRPGWLTGRSRRGRAMEPWTGEALAPAGGVRASLAAMVRLTAALLDGSAPGVAALDPVAPLGGRAAIGAAWITLEGRGRRVTWHNGGTGGFRTWLGVDRDAGAGVVVLSATASPVDRAGFALLAGLAAPEATLGGAVR